MPPPAGFVLEIRDLCKTFRQGHCWQKQFYRHALKHINLNLPAGNTLGLVGESGCGKTTLAMCVVGLETPDQGETLLKGTNLPALGKPGWDHRRREIQLIFQDSSGALNPRMSAFEIVEEPLRLHGGTSRCERQELVAAMMEQVGISPNWKRRLPHEFSGGQRQRLAIARALVLKPSVLILDEIFVGLDLSIQGQIANLLLELQQSHGLSYICISHNFALVSHFAHTIAVMEDGCIVRRMSSYDFFEASRDASTAVFKNARQATGSAMGAHSGA